MLSHLGGPSLVSATEALSWEDFVAYRITRKGLDVSP